MFATANYWGSCRPQAVPVQSSHVDFAAKRGIANLIPEFGGCSFGQNAAIEVAAESLLERVGGDGRGGRIVTSTIRGGRCRATSVSSGYRVKVTDQSSYEEVWRKCHVRTKRGEAGWWLGTLDFSGMRCMRCRRTDDAVGGSPTLNLTSGPWKRAGLG